MAFGLGQKIVTHLFTQQNFSKISKFSNKQFKKFVRKSNSIIETSLNGSWFYLRLPVTFAFLKRQMAEMLSRQHAKRTCARRMTPSTSARLYRSGVKMTIRTKEVDEDDNIWLHGYMDDDQVRVALSQVPALMRNNDARA